MNHPHRRLHLPRLALALPLAIFALALTPLGLFAQDNRDAVIGLYLKEKGGRVTCSKLTPISCGDPEAITRGDLYAEYVAYLGVFNADAQLGVAGIQCALRYDDGSRSGVDIDSWTLCADIDFAQDGWPGSAGAGNTIVWVNGSEMGCEREEPAGIGTGVTAIAGFFFLTAYGDDKLQIAPWRGEGPAVPYGKISDCTAKEYIIAPENLGYVVFSDDSALKGRLPCTQRVQERTTWGTVKELYNDR